MSKVSNYNGIGLNGALFLVLLVLKLTHYIDWSWWVVTSPLWLPAAMITIVIAIGWFILLIMKWF